MKKIIPLIALLFPIALFSQGPIASKVAALKQMGAFQQAAQKTFLVPAANFDAAIGKTTHKYTLLSINKRVAEIIRDKPEFLTLKVPFEKGTNSFTLLLYKQNVTEGSEAGLHYRGSIDADLSSLASFNFGDEVSGFISNKQGTWELGKVKSKSGKRDRYVIYNTGTSKLKPAFTCGELQAPARTKISGGPTPKPLAYNALSNKCTRIYWEADYDLFQQKGSVAATNAYMQGVFNEVSTIYENDNIHIILSGTFVWDVPDPYTGPGTLNYLDQFGTYVEQHPGRLNGDIGMLIGTQGNGGVAWINGLCAGAPRYQVGYAGIFSSYNTVPSYSWTVEVLTHEMGHLFGSSHTHDCYQWAGGVRIDSCGDYAGYTSCQPPPPAPIRLPVGGGTIMSYCHLTAVGINFSKGFGPQPSAAIRANIEAQTCLTTCGPPPPPPPNQPPVANAGSNQMITLPTSTTTLSGSGTDADGTVVAYHWLLSSGPGGSVIASPSSAITQVSGLVVGVYIFQLTVTDDKGATGNALVNVTVNAAPPPPPPGQTFTDNFNRPDDPFIRNGWLTAKGNWFLFNNELNNASSTVLQENILLQPTFYDTAQAAFAGVDMNTGPRFGLVLCYQNATNYYLLYRNTGGSAQLRISKVVNGVETILKTKNMGNPSKCTTGSADAPTNCFFKLRARKIGNVLNLDVNGVNQVSIADNTFPASGGTGVYIQAKGFKHRIDNFSAQ